MPKKKAPREPAREMAFEVVSTAPELWAAHFLRHEAKPEKARGGIEFRQVLSRNHKRHLMVQLTVSLKDMEWAEVEVTYRVGYLIRGQIEDDDLEQTIRELAARVAPVGIYPFVRETILSLSQKSGGLPISLPIVDFAQHIATESVEIPETDDPGPAELLAPVEA